MLNVMVVSDFNPIKELFRSALRSHPNVDGITLVSGAGVKAQSKFSFGSQHSTPDVIVYDLDSSLHSPEKQLERMEEVISTKALSKHGAASLVVVASDVQLGKLQSKVCFLDAYVITKPFTFKQVVQMVNNVWTTSNLVF